MRYTAAQEDRLSRAELVARRLDTPLSVLGILFVLLVLAQNLAQDPALMAALSVAGWVLWAVFVAEFVLRAVIARDQRRFWRRNWWQLLFLAVPFLRFLRAIALVRVLRVARVGGVVSAALRSSRSAGRLLSGRVTWLSAVTLVVVLSVSQILYITGAYDDYGTALHDVALGTTTGEPLSAAGAASRLVEVLLGVYSVGVFATLAGALGAYFLQRRDEADQPPPGDGPHGRVPASAGRAATERVPMAVPAEQGQQAPAGHRPSGTST